MMREYPSIPRQINRQDRVYVFDKIDGSNVRAEWRNDRGFWKYGTRRGLMDRQSDPILGQSIDLMLEHEDGITSVCQKKGYEKVTCFFEFAGPYSFAGQHDPDDDFEVHLFDVWPKREGSIINPDDFLDLFGHLDIPEPLYYGRLNDSIVDSIRDGSLDGMTYEGVVCKSPTRDDHSHPDMFKIESDAWLDEVA